MSHDVFISYSTRDKLIADAVCAKLEESKVRAWIAPRDVPAGANFAESIINAIDTCKVFVLIWSANTNTSEHILTELNQAFGQGITIIPFRIQDVQPTSAMRYYIGRTHWLDALTPPLEKHISALQDTILRNLEREPLATEPNQIPPALQVIKKEKPAPGKKQPTAITSSKRLMLALLAAGGILLLGVTGLLLSGKLGSLLSPNQSQPTAQSSPTTDQVKTASPDVILTSTISPTALPTRTPTQFPVSTPVPDWVRDVSAPIWTYMFQKPPDFRDDFDQDNGLWRFIPEPGYQDCDDPDDAVKEISDGTMKLSIVNCRVGNLIPSGFNYANYVLQLEVDYHTNAIGLEFRIYNQSPKSKNVGDIFFNIVSPEGFISFQMEKTNNVGIATQLYLPRHLFYPSKPVTLTIINQNPYIIIYVDSTIIVAYDTLEPYQGPWGMDFTVNSWDTTPTEYQMLELDNVKIWDLDKIKK